MPVEAITPTPPPAQSTLLASLSDFRSVLPISETTKNDVLRVLHHPQTDANRVAKAAAQHPALILLLILTANQALKKQNIESRYLPHCISLIGLPAVEQLINATPTYSDNEGYEEQLNQSWIAADLSRQLGLTAKTEDSEPVFLSCLTIRFHELAMWSQYPEKMEQIERLKANPVYNHDQIETRILGITLNDLGKHLAPLWPLPQATQECWENGFQLQARRSDESINKNNCLKLCHVVSSLGCRSWYHPETLNAQTILAQETKLTPDETAHFSHQSCVKAPLKGWYQLHPAARLLQAWEHQRALTPLFWETPKQTITTPSGKTHKKATPNHATPKPSPATEKVEATLLEESLNRLNHRGHSFSDLNDLLLFSLNTLHQAFEASKAMILILNSERTQLRVQYCRGANGLSGKRMDLNTQQTGLLQKALKDPSGLHITSENQHQCISQLSPRLASIFATEHSAMVPIFHHKQPLGIIFISKANLSPASFTDFRKLCHATNNAISEVARVRHRPNAS